MPFNNNRSGIQNEIDFINQLNNKKIKHLNILLQCFIYDLYGKIDIIVYGVPNDFIWIKRNDIYRIIYTL